MARHEFGIFETEPEPGAVTVTELLGMQLNTCCPLVILVIPSGWEKLIEKYYDVMYSESYDRWTLAMAIDYLEEQVSELKKYEFDSEDDCGISVFEQGGRTIIVINCRLDASCLDDPYEDYNDYEEDEDEDEDDDGDRDNTGSSLVSDNELLNLLVQLREQLVQGDYRSLYSVWEKYSYSVDDDALPIPSERSHGKDIIEQFSNMLE